MPSSPPLQLPAFNPSLVRDTSKRPATAPLKAKEFHIPFEDFASTIVSNTRNNGLRQWTRARTALPTRRIDLDEPLWHIDR
ncbi:hypothetical protein HDU99_003051, partial [Rhizoclosmatium hyalinum]